jgi:hypothetical protein
MTLLDAQAFENGDRSLYTQSGRFQLDTGRFGGFSLRADIFYSSISKAIPASTEVVVGTALFFGSISPTVNHPMHVYYEGATLHVAIQMTASNTLQIIVGTTVVATVSAPPWRLGWNYLESKVRVNSSTGYVEVRLNGVVTPILTFSGNTRNGGTGVINIMQLELPDGWRVDDWVIMDTLGSTLNDFIGEVRLSDVVPTGAGSSTGFTPSTGANWSNVDESGPSSTDYNSSGVSGTRDLYAMSNVAGSQVLGVFTSLWAHRGDTAPVSIKLAMKNGSTISYGATNLLTSAMVLYQDAWGVNPDTGTAWTVSDVNAMELGAEVV